MRYSAVLTLLVAAPALAQISDLPNLSTVTQPDGSGRATATSAPASTSASARSSATAQSSSVSLSDFSLSNAPATTTTAPSTTVAAGATSIFHLSAIPTIDGVGVPNIKVPDTAGAAFMQKSNLPDGTVFICVGAILAGFAAAVLAWRALVAWSLHRSVKRAAQAQNLADITAMSAVPGKKRGMYNIVGNQSSTMSLDHLSAAPPGMSKSLKPFASTPGGTPPRSQTSLFFSPTAGGPPGGRDSMVNRSSTYLPAGYYAAGTAQAASGAAITHVGGHAPHPSTHSLLLPGNPASIRSGLSPPGSPALQASRGYDRVTQSRDGATLHHRSSIGTLGRPNTAGGTLYSNEHGNMSQFSLNAPGGNGAGGRAPSTYLEDLFENHGNGPRERF